MTIIEQRAAESMAKNLPRILKELKRANELSALRLEMYLDECSNEMHIVRQYRRRFEAIMEEE